MKKSDGFGGPSAVVPWMAKNSHQPCKAFLNFEDFIREGSFTEASEETVVLKIRQLVESITAETILHSDSASNLLAVNGKLPDEQKEMLEEIDAYLELSQNEKHLFSLRSRLEYFNGQYGGLTEDLHQAILPMEYNGTFSREGVADEEIKAVIKLIRGKLMP